MEHTVRTSSMYGLYKTSKGVMTNKETVRTSSMYGLYKLYGWHVLFYQMV